MKKLLALAVATTLIGGCTSINPFSDNEKDFTVSQSSDNMTPVKEQTVGLVNDEGIKIYYSLAGNLERIEVYGMAPAWKGNVEVVAEADAKERLVKYLYDESVTTDRSVEVITRTLDKARDNALNQIENGLAPSAVVEFDQEDVEADVADTTPVETNSNNTSRRVAERIEETKINTLTRITSGGNLRGMRKVGSQIRDNGRVYVAVYQWSEKDQVTANTIRSKMFGN